MGRKSTLRRLPPEVYAEINRLLSEGRLTLDELLEHLRGLGVEGVSRSALGRQKQKIDKMAARLRQSREMTEALVREIGPSVAEGHQGRLLVRILRDLVLNHLASLPEEEEADSGSFMQLARALKDMAHANRLDQDFETKIREDARREAEKKMEKAVDAVTGAPGGAALTPAEMRERLLAAYRGE